MKIVINDCYGGFSLSEAGFERYLELKKIEWEKTVSYSLPHYWKKGQVNVNKAYLYDRDIERSDSDLVKVVEEMGEIANGRCAKLKVVEIPEGVEWEIDEYDGMEHVAEKHQTWG